jgi:hypothetical protein
MGAIVEGFETARQKHEEQLAEARARELLVEDQLQALGKVLDEDTGFLKQHGMSHAIRARKMHIEQKRVPLITAHFDPAEKTFNLTFMKDGVHATFATPEEAGRAIGAHVFDLQRRQ